MSLAGGAGMFAVSLLPGGGCTGELGNMTVPWPASVFCTYLVHSGEIFNTGLTGEVTVNPSGSYLFPSPVG